MHNCIIIAMLLGLLCGNVSGRAANENPLGTEYHVASIPSGRFIKVNSKLVSANGKYSAMLDIGGNLCVNDGSGDRVYGFKWCSGSLGLKSNYVAYVNTAGILQILPSAPEPFRNSIGSEARTCGYYMSSSNRAWNLASIEELSYGDHFVKMCGTQCASPDSQIACTARSYGLGSLNRVTISDISENSIQIRATNWDEPDCNGISRSTVITMTAESRASPAITNVTISGCQYNIAISVPHSVRGCPNNCNGRGVCVNGTCVCNGTALGSDCSIGCNANLPYVNPFDGRKWNLYGSGGFFLNTNKNYRVFLRGQQCFSPIHDYSHIACEDGMWGLGKVATASITPISANSIKLKAVNGSVDRNCPNGRSSTVIIHVGGLYSNISSISVSGGCDYTITIFLAQEFVTPAVLPAAKWASDNTEPGARLILTNYGSLQLVSPFGKVVWQSIKDYKSIVHRFAPVFYYHPDEGYPPMSIDYYLSHVGMDVFNGWSGYPFEYYIATERVPVRMPRAQEQLVADRNRLAGYVPWLKDYNGKNYNTDDTPSGLVSYLVDRTYDTSQPWTSSNDVLPDGILRNYVVIRDFGTAIEMTYFQLFGYNSVPNMPYANHQGDWCFVRISVTFVDNAFPISSYDYEGHGVRYNYHTTKRTFYWWDPEVPKANQDQVIVYVAHGTHEYHWKVFCTDENAVFDVCSADGPRRDARQGEFEMYFWDGSDFVDKASQGYNSLRGYNSPGWLAYRGRWGNAASGCITKDDEACKRVSGPNGMYRPTDYTPLFYYDGAPNMMV